MFHEIEIDRNAHAVSMLDRMEEMMREESLCDFTIKVGSKEIKTHRVVLAAGSDYFRSMLRSDMKESQSGFVNMADIDFECMKICLDFIYNNKVTIPVEKYEDLVYVANMLQLNKFCNFIYAKLDKELDSRLFFPTRRIADMYGQKKLEEKCVKFAEENFVSISNEDRFKELDKEYVHKIINLKNVNMTEDEKLDVVLRFVKVEKKRRKQLTEMIEWLDLDKVSLEQREEIMENEPLVSDNLKVYKIFTTSLKNTFKQQLEASKAEETTEVEMHAKGSYEMQSPRTVLRPSSGTQLGAARSESGMVLFDNASKNLLRFNPRDNTMTQMKEMFDGMKRRHYSAVVVDDYVCVLMNQKFHGFKYSDATSPWEQMPNMICDHGEHPPVTAAIGCIFICGGSYPTGTVAFEKFDLRARQWARLKNKPRASVNAAILEFIGNVYSIGGWVEGNATKRVERFNIASSTWTEVAPMKYARQGAAVVEANGSFFVLGGRDGGASLDKVESYCVSSNQWTRIKPMKIARYWSKAFAIDETIYAVGGQNSDAAQGSIEKYQVTRDEWEVVRLSFAGWKLNIYDSVEIKI